MTGRLYDEDPLTPEEVAAFEDDVISFCDRELNLLGDITNLHVLYAGGSSPLWLEGLSQRIGEGGALTALETEEERVREARRSLREADLAAPIRIIQGNVFHPPFSPETFELVYSTGLFHELDVREGTAAGALAALASVARPGGRVATSDFVDAEPATQLEDEDLDRELAREASGAQLYGIGPPERLVALHETVLRGVRWRVLPPYPFHYLDKVVLGEGEPEELEILPTETRRRLRERREAFRERVAREGYIRPATVYVEGFVG